MAVQMAARDGVRLLSLEITGKCQLACVHCYADSGPHGTHGTMALADWKRVIDEAHNAGVTDVQFIGGEPTLHPDLPQLIRHSLGLGLDVEVFSNLVHVRPEVWAALSLDKVRLATSYYSADAGQHNAVTLRRSHDRTLRNIKEALRRSIPLRVSVTGIRADQNVDVAIAELSGLAITEINVDHLREIGRGGVRESVDQLCGQCGIGKIAVSPTGDVWPCLLSRWITLGNVRQKSLHEVCMSSIAVRAELAAEFQLRPAQRPCNPGDGGCGAPVCSPLMGCGPGGCGPGRRADRG